MKLIYRSSAFLLKDANAYLVIFMIYAFKCYIG